MRGCNPGATRQLQVLLVERRWRGASQRTDCGLAGYDLCQPESELTLRLSLDIRQCRLHQFRSDTKHFIERYEVVWCVFRTYKLCLTPGGSVCSKSFSVEKYQPRKKEESSELVSFTFSHTETTPKHYYTEDQREKIKLFYQELDQSSEGEDEELDGIEMHEVEETRRMYEIIRRLLEIFLIILITVSTILCICLLCLLKFC